MPTIVPNSINCYGKFEFLNQVYKLLKICRKGRFISVNYNLKGIKKQYLKQVMNSRYGMI